MQIKTYEELKKCAEKATSNELVDLLSFNEIIKLSYAMLENDEWDESLQEYAVALLEIVREKHKHEWESSWEYEAFLGYAYHLILKYNLRFKAFKNALDKVGFPPPPKLLVGMVRCCITPGPLPISVEEAISLLEKSIEKVPYIESLELLIGLNKLLGDQDQCNFWEKILNSQRENPQHLPTLYPFESQG